MLKAPYKIVGLSGSTRIGSTNTALLRLIGELAPKDRVASFEILDYKGIPVYDGDDETETGVPDKIKVIAEKIAQADGVYISTPEYNYSFSAPLKNSLDWISRVNGQNPNPMAGKPVAITSVSAGLGGGLRAQYDLRKVLLYFRVHNMSLPELSISQNYLKFDKFKESKQPTILIDDMSKKFAQAHINAFVDHIDFVRRGNNKDIDKPIQAQGCLTTRITKNTQIFCIGHLPIHIDAKVAEMKKLGFVNAESMYAQEMSADQIKQVLASSKNALLYVGGAMEKEHPVLCQDLYQWQPTGAPTLAIQVLGIPHFKKFWPGFVSPPPTNEMIAQVSAYHVQEMSEAWNARS